MGGSSRRLQKVGYRGQVVELGGESASFKELAEMKATNSEMIKVTGEYLSVSFDIS